MSNDYHESLRVGNVEHAAKRLDFCERDVSEAESYLPTRAQKPKSIEIFEPMLGAVWLIIVFGWVGQAGRFAAIEKLSILGRIF